MRKNLNSFGDTFGAGPRNVDAVISVVVRGGSKIPNINTVGGPGAAVSGCFMDNNAGAGGCLGCAVLAEGTVQLGFHRKSWIEAGGT